MITVLISITQNKLNPLDIINNSRGEPDIAIFDFTTLCHAENAARFMERNGKKLYLSLVGDSLFQVTSYFLFIKIKAI